MVVGQGMAAFARGVEEAPGNRVLVGVHGNEKLGWKFAG